MEALAEDAAPRDRSATGLTWLSSTALPYRKIPRATNSKNFIE